MVKTWVLHYLPKQEEFKNLCFVVVLIKKQKLQPFAHVTLNGHSRSIFLYGLCL